MKQLFIIRHAKSDWGDPDLADFDRPLNARGKKAAPMMGERLYKRQVSFDAMISSPAKRAITTARIIAEKVGFDPKDIQEDPKLYMASASDLEETLWGADDALNSLALVAHNPGITEFANHYAEELIANLPTCAVVSIEFEIRRWNEASLGAVRSFDFDYPKKISNT